VKPGCRIVRSSAREKLTIWADFQFSFHWLLISTRIRSCCKGLPDGRQVISEWIGQLSCAVIFSMSSSVAAFLRKAGGSVLAKTGNHGRGAECRVPEMRRKVLLMPCDTDTLQMACKCINNMIQQVLILLSKIKAYISYICHWYPTLLMMNSSGCRLFIPTLIPQIILSCRSSAHIAGGHQGHSPILSYRTKHIGD